MRHPRYRRLALAFLLALVPLWACDDSGVEGAANGTAALSVYLTDAPGDVEEVWVEILGITLQGGSNGPVDLLGAPTDLIPLTDLVGVTQLLSSEVELEPDTYGQLRMVVGDAYLVSSDGTVYVKGDPVLPVELEGAPTGDLQCPSCSQSGLKVTIPGDEITLEEGLTVLVLDFDVAQSFGHRAGNSGKWVMHPVIHGTLTDQPTDARAILGTVDVTRDTEGNPTITIPECPAGTARGLADFIPTATSDDYIDGEGNSIVRFGNVAEDGSFQIGFLAAGSYTLGYEDLALEGWTLNFTASVEPTQVMVGDVDVEGVAYTIEAATCDEVAPSS